MNEEIEVDEIFENHGIFKAKDGNIYDVVNNSKDIIIRKKGYFEQKRTETNDDRFESKYWVNKNGKIFQKTNNGLINIENHYNNINENISKPLICGEYVFCNSAPSAHKNPANNLGYKRYFALKADEQGGYDDITNNLCKSNEVINDIICARNGKVTYNVARSTDDKSLRWEEISYKTSRVQVTTKHFAEWKPVSNISDKSMKILNAVFSSKKSFEK